MLLFVLAASGLALLALPWLARPVGRCLHPREWARLCMVAVAGGALVVELTVLLYAAPTLAASFGVPGLARLCERMLGHLAMGGSVAGWAATGVAVMLPALGAWAWSRARRVTCRARIEPWLGRHHDHDGHRVVVLPTSHLLAVSVPATRGRGLGQIVVSDGLVGLLAPGELDAVVRHEVAHLRHGHHRYLVAAAVVDVAFRWFPLARRSTGTLRVALERWADEEAAATSGNRSVVRDALLMVTQTLVADPAVAAFSAAETIGERLDALDASAPRLRLAPHALLYFPGVALGVAGVIAWSSWTSEAHAVVAMAGQCTI